MVLHHELLLALAGHVGGEIFVERDGTFVMADDLPLLDRSERVAVSDLLPLGALYRDLNAFVERHLCGALAAGASGLYVRALCRGIDAELDAYRHALVVIEDACKSAAADGLGALAARARSSALAAEAEVSAGLSLMRMQHEMTEHRSTIPALHRLATIIDEEGLQGARVLEAVHAQASALARTPTGDCLRRLLRHCNATLLHQARGWMTHGVRFDPHAEFFIQPAAAISSAIRRRGAGGGGGGGSAARTELGSLARTPGTPAQPDGSTLGTPRTPDEPEAPRRSFAPATIYRTAHRPARAADGAGGAEEGGETDEGGSAELFGEVSDLTEQIAADWRELSVSLFDKPSYLSLRLAERVLFIGKAARVLEHRTFLRLARPRARAPGAAAARRGGSRGGNADGSGEEEEGEDAADEADAAAVLALDERLESLQWAAELPALELAAAVDELAAIAARRLWRFVIVESGLALRLHALRALALTARGDVFHSLVREAAHVMAAKRLPSDRQLTALLHSAAAAARTQLPARAHGSAARPAERRAHSSAGGGEAAAVGSEEHSRAVLGLICEHFELRLAAGARAGGVALPPGAAAGDPLEPSGAVLGRWRAVRLWWRTEWPLNLVFGDDALRRYNGIFSFLLTVRVVQTQLHVRRRGRRAERLPRAQRAAAALEPVAASHATAFSWERPIARSVR